MTRHRFRYYSKNRKLLYRFTVVLTCTFLVVLFSLFMQMQMFETKKEQNEQIYGSWQGAVYAASQKSEQTIKDHQMVDTIGTMVVLADVQTNDLFSGSLGYGDDAFFALANLELRDGHFPEKDNEIMIEQMKLDQMGLDYTLGQTISIQLVREDTVIEKEYVLCGILNNYSASWLSSGRLISYFVVEDESLSALETSFFFTVRDHYLDSLEDLLSMGTTGLILNTNVEFIYDPVSDQNLPFTILSVFAILYSILILIYLLHQWTKNHAREIQMLKALGAGTLLFVLDFFRLLFMSLLLPLCLFVASACLLCIPLSLSGLALGISLISLLVVCLSCLIEIVRIPVNVNSFTEEMATVGKTFRVQYKKITPFRLVLRSLRFHRKQELLQIGICCMLLIFSYFTLSLTVENLYKLKQIEKMPDITVGSRPGEYYSFSYFDEEGYEHVGTRFMMEHIETSVADRFTENRAIQSYRSCYQDNRYYAKWEDMEHSELLKNEQYWQGRGLINEDWNRNKNPFLPIYSSEDPSYYTFLSQHIDEGDWVREEFDQGDAVYIYLPSYTYEIYGSEGNKHLYWDSDPNTFYDENMIFQEQTISVGDMIVLQAKDQPAKECRIAGIIRTPYSMEDTGIPDSIYQIFVSSGFYGGRQPVSSISLYFDPDQNNEVLESHFSTVASQNHLIFTNQSQEKRRQREAVRNELLLFLVICIGIFMVLLFTRILFVSQRRKEVRYQNTVFRQLGIDEKVFRSIRIQDALIKLPWILLISFLIYVLCRYLLYLPDQRLMNPFRNQFSNQHWSWTAFFLIDMAFVLFYVLTSSKIYEPFRQTESKSKRTEEYLHHKIRIR